MLSSSVYDPARLKALLALYYLLQTLVAEVDDHIPCAEVRRERVYRRLDRLTSRYEQHHLPRNGE
eukprot:CAMPEP_0181251106 /NCGR_PEP_ID=MMETSP1096-20121128/46693_1 /TAXON_ID=156174 ORGANISM="Chrysochromulina ericina, Strain CCMP281" /NCGR_SAMPLE_ID=MMETSP1096 /ASSEMBLY_ACC=CAM_ASM_000453 /LENGTH=64 /DNA_ID=CAMNT_0023348653 /DNA_START=316 /DNA_END=510 /DNA_ORIENTATION=+